MKKRILFAILGLVIVIAVLAAVKAMQIRAMIEQGKKAVPPPETVTTALARAESWETSLSAVGSLSSCRGSPWPPNCRQGRGDRIRTRSESDSGGSPDPPGYQRGRGPASRRRGSGDVDATVLERNIRMLAEKIISQAEYDASCGTSRRLPGELPPRHHRQKNDPRAVRRPLGIRQVNLGPDSPEGDPVVTLQSLDPIFVNFALPSRNCPGCG